MAPKGKRRLENIEQNEEDAVENNNDDDEAGNEADEKGEDEFTLDDVLRLGGTKVKARVQHGSSLSPRGNMDTCAVLTGLKT